MAEIAVNSATKLVDGLLGQLSATISGELSLLLGVREEIKYIKDELEIMSAFLRAAEEKQTNNGAARAWVKQVRELAYLVEDCIDEFSLRLDRRGSHNFVHAWWRRARSVGTRHRIATQIRSIKSMVEEVSNRRIRYDIKESSNASIGDNIARYDHRASPSVEESQLVGIDDPKRKLLGWLSSESGGQINLVAVVGPGGSGKTTVARRAYESLDVAGEKFDCRAWITVSESYHVEGILQNMIRQLSSPPKEEGKLEKTRVSDGPRGYYLPKHPDNMLEREGLIAELMDVLLDKRYVIVFDDVWSIAAIQSLQCALPKNNRGSRIILTTRFKDIPEACQTEYPVHVHEHEKLNPDQSYVLFCTRVFDNPGHVCPPTLETTAQAILKKCDGLPLAIVAIARVLAGKPQTAQEWKKIKNHLGSEIENNPNLEAVRQVLGFGYIDLPYHVKRCFLYLSKFPEDCLIERKYIQRLWVAEGFAGDRRDMTADEVAESYFNELVNRCMILPSAFSANGKVRSFRVHDILFEVIRSKSVEDNFLSLLGKRSAWLPQDRFIRRLSLHAEHNPESLNLSNVSSLTMSRGGWLPLTSPSLGLLRVLDLEGCRVLSDDGIKTVVKLLHLKYLSLRNTKVSLLPDSLGNLQKLEMLDIKNSSVRSLPSSVIKLRRLRFLRGGRPGLPLDGIQVPTGIGDLGNLEELAVVIIGEDHREFMEQLKKLTCLRKLAVSGLKRKEGIEYFCDALKVVSGSLCSLNLHSGDTLGFLHKLTSPPPLLESLKLEGGLGKLPRWISSHNSNVVKVFLKKSNLDRDAMELLKILPKLAVLHLTDNAYVEERLRFGVGGFASLKVLHIEDLPLRSLHFEQGTTPRIESVSLVILRHSSDNKPISSERMSIFGIKNLPILKKISIDHMHRVDLASVRIAANEHPNHPTVRASNVSFKRDQNLQ